MTNFRKSHREGRFATATILLILITMAFIPIMGSAQETSFVLARIFQNPSPNVGDEFDHAVAIDGNNVLIGAGLDDTIAEDAGIAYLFDVNTGQLLRTFQNPMPDAGDHFGHGAAIDDNNVLIGALWDEERAVYSGVFYLFVTDASPTT